MSSTQPENPAENTGKSDQDPQFDPEKAWRESFDAFERTIGRPMEAFLESEEFADAAAAFLKANTQFQAQLARGAEAWHDLAKAPTETGIDRLSAGLDEVREQLAALTERVAATENQIRSAESAGPARRPIRTAKPTRHADG
jgi:hypothetical protein